MKKVVLLLVVLIVVAFAPISLKAQTYKQNLGDGQSILVTAGMAGFQWPVGLRNASDSINYLANFSMGQQQLIKKLQGQIKNNAKLKKELKATNDEVTALRKEFESYKAETEAELKQDNERLNQYAISLNQTQQELSEAQRQIEVMKRGMHGLYEDMISGDSANYARITENQDSINNVQSRQIDVLDEGITCIHKFAKFPNKYYRQYMRSQQDVSSNESSTNVHVAKGRYVSPPEPVSSKSSTFIMTEGACHCSSKYKEAMDAIVVRK